MSEQNLTEAEELREKRLELEASEMTKVLGDPAMLWFLWRLIQYAGVYRSFGGLSGDERVELNGMREVGLWIIGELVQHDPLALERMRREADSRMARLALEQSQLTEEDRDV